MKRDARGWAGVHLWEVQILRDVAAFAAVLGLLWLGNLTRVVTVPLLLALLLAYLTEPITSRLARVEKIGRKRAVILILVTVIFGVGIPGAAGLTIGVGQAIDVGRSWSERLGEVRASVASPDDARLREQVPEGAWRFIRDRLVEQGVGEVEAEPAADVPVGEGETTESAAGAPADGDEVVDGSSPNVRDEVPAEAEDGSAAPRTPRPWATAVLDLARANTDALASGLLTAGERAAGVAAAVVGGIVTLTVTVFLTLLFYFFVAVQWPSVVRFGRSMVPVAERRRAVDLARKMDGVVSGFVRGRLTIAVILGVFFSIAYAAIGVPAAVIVGVATGVLGVAPYAGLLGLPVAIVLLWLEGHTGVRGHWLWVIGMPIVVYNAGQLLDDYLLTPKIQGKATGLDTPAVLFATLAGGALMGVYGLLIAIPIAACLKILIAEVVWPAVERWLKGESEDFLPIGDGSES